MKVCVTGSSGFVGKNLIAMLSGMTDVEILRFDIGDTQDTLRSHLTRADVVYHLAGVNRPDCESEFITGNTGLTEDICAILERLGRDIPVVMSSSAQAALDNAYGRSKKAAEDALLKYGNTKGHPVYIFRFPGIFGKWCRPNYNSVVATFCHNIARDLPIRIHDESTRVTLAYIDDVVSAFLRLLHARPAYGFCGMQPTYEITLGDLARRLLAFRQSRLDLTKTYSHADPLTDKLYATYLSYLPEDGFSVKGDMKTDARGYFCEILKSLDFGQISISRTKPGVKRGDHFHNTKTEKFIVIEGTALIRFRKPEQAEIIEYRVSGDALEIVDIPPGYAHAITNIGDTDLVTLFWASEVYDPDNPDTHILVV